MFPDWPRASIPTIVKGQMAEVDRVMVEDLHITLIQMMENAGRNLARFTMETMVATGRARSAIVLAGTGGNGGGGLVAARRLTGWGVPVSVWITKPIAQYTGVIAQQLQTLVSMGVPISSEGAPAGTGYMEAVAIDALIGYSLTGAPRGRAALLVEWANDACIPVVSLDIPSGLDASTGMVVGSAVEADATLTLALPKVGLVVERSTRYVGELYLADIGVPADLYRRLFGLDVGDLFIGSDIVRLVPAR